MLEQLGIDLAQLVQYLVQLAQSHPDIDGTMACTGGDSPRLKRYNGWYSK